MVNVGTGSQISCIVSGMPDKCDMDRRPLVDGLYLLAGSSLCGGRAYAILEKFLRDTAMLVTGLEIDSDYLAMNRVMENYVLPEQQLIVDDCFVKTFKMPLSIPANKEEAAFEAALFGLTTATPLQSIKEVQKLIQ